MTRWEDGATGLRVDFIVITLAGCTGEGNLLPPTIEGPQFAVTRRGGQPGRFVVGNTRTADGLAALGVSAATIDLIKQEAGQ